MSYLTQIEKDIDETISEVLPNSNSDRLLNFPPHNSRNESVLKTNQTF